MVSTKKSPHQTARALKKRKKKTESALQRFKRLRKRIAEFRLEPRDDAVDDGVLMPNEVGVFGAFYHHEFHVVTMRFEGVVHVFGLQGAHKGIVRTVHQEKRRFVAVDVIKSTRVMRGFRGFA